MEATIKITKKEVNNLGEEVSKLTVNGVEVGTLVKTLANASTQGYKYSNTKKVEYRWNWDIQEIKENFGKWNGRSFGTLSTQPKASLLSTIFNENIA